MTRDHDGRLGILLRVGFRVIEVRFRGKPHVWLWPPVSPHAARSGSSPGSSSSTSSWLRR